MYIYMPTLRLILHILSLPLSHFHSLNWSLNFLLSKHLLVQYIMSSSTYASSSTSPSTLSGHPPPRMPHDSQKNLGSDMIMFFFGQTETPTRFPTSDGQLIRSLNVEALVRVFLPPPPYMTLPEYSVLRPEEHRSPDLLPIYFSLNLSIYNQQIVESEWENQWFHFTG
jgi:hypothetical protein